MLKKCNWTIDVKYSEDAKSYEALATLENDGVKTEYQVIRKDSKKWKVDGFDKEKYSFGFCSSYAKTPEEALKMAKEFIDKKHKEMVALEELKSKNITIKYDPESDTLSDIERGNQESKIAIATKSLLGVLNDTLYTYIHSFESIRIDETTEARKPDIQEILRSVYGDN